MSNKISALIFSINEYDLVHPKIKLLYPYVDEIVIIDSSTDKKQKRLMKNLEKKYKKVRVIWLPPLGVVDFYYRIGINECRYNWIFYLEADDVPSKKLLEDLRRLVNDKYDAYVVWRGSYEFRIIKKKFSFPLGLLHWLLSTKGRNFRCLEPNKYFIISKKRESLKGIINRYLVKYAYIESFQIPAKLLYFVYLEKNNIFVKISFNRLKSKIYKLFSIFSNLNLITLYLTYFMYLISLSAFSSINFKLSKSIWFRYPFYIFKNFIKSPYKNLYIGIKIYERGFYDFFELDRKEYLLQNAKELNFGSSGTENFKKLLEKRFKESISMEKF